MYASGSISGQQMCSGAAPQPCFSGYITSGQFSPGCFEKMVRWGKATVIPALLLGVAIEVVKCEVSPHLEPPGIVKPIDLGPITPPIATSGAIVS